MNIINRTFFVGTFLGTAGVLVAMESVPAKAQEKTLKSNKLTEKAFIAKLSKAAMQRNFAHYFELLSQEPIEKQKQLCNTNLYQGEQAFVNKNALHFASEQGNSDAVRKLLELGAHVNEHDTDYMTPFLYAAQQGNLALLALLLEKGADRNAHDNKAMTALHWAAAGQLCSCYYCSC